MKKIFLITWLVFWGTAHAALEPLGEVPSFQLTDSHGKKFQREKLKGSVWVADFIFTSCQGQCPILGQKMAQLQKKFASQGLRLVSFTVDPKRDTPATLATYSKRFHADANHWSFVTGNAEKLNTLIRDGFFLGAGGSTGEEIAHSFRFVLVDKQLRIRGYYSVLEDEAFSRLQKDIETLLAAKS